ncbi:hypothetical protein [Ruminococcus gauvreauii]
MELWTLEDILGIGMQLFPIGFLLGCLPMLIGLLVSMVFKIFKNL